MDYLNDVFTIGKYIVIVVAVLGVIVLTVGLSQKQQQLITRGGYLIVLSIVLAVCGYVVYTTTIDRVEDRINYIESSITGDY